MSKALFLDKCDFSKNGCWIWNAAVRADGYGQFHIKRKPMGAHRASYLLFVGELQNGDLVCHRCDNPICVNPAHLFIGTPADNSADMVKKGRQARGEKHGSRKLSEMDVLAIRGMAGTQLEIAKSFGVDRSLIGYIRRGDLWGHV